FRRVLFRSLGNVMAHLAESLRMIAVMLKPFLPETPIKIFTQLGITDESLHTWDSLSTIGAIPAGATIEKGDPIFPRLEAAEEVGRIKELMSPKGASEAPVEDAKEEI